MLPYPALIKTEYKFIFSLFWKVFWKPEYVKQLCYYQTTLLFIVPNVSSIGIRGMVFLLCSYAYLHAWSSHICEKFHFHFITLQTTSIGEFTAITQCISFPPLFSASLNSYLPSHCNDNSHSRTKPRWDWNKMRRKKVINVCLLIQVVLCSAWCYRFRSISQITGIQLSQASLRNCPAKEFTNRKQKIFSINFHNFKYLWICLSWVRAHVI